LAHRKGQHAGQNEADNVRLPPRAHLGVDPLGVVAGSGFRNAHLGRGFRDGCSATDRDGEACLAGKQAKQFRNLFVPIDDGIFIVLRLYRIMPDRGDAARNAI